MKRIALAAAFACALAGKALAWGQEGHSIVAEIAQQRLTPEAARMVQELLKGRSLASIASWADDYRAKHSDTANWHFVDIPIDADTYDPARDCKPNPAKGDCIIAELDRLRNDVRCAKGEAQVEALKLTVHFVGDIHQPLHTVLENAGGNGIPVDVFMHGLICPACAPTHTGTNFHTSWDTTLVEKTVWDWGAYVDRLEAGWLASSPEAKQEDPLANHAPIDKSTFKAWAEETHKAAQKVWHLLPAADVIDDGYLSDVLPVMDRQLGVAGLRLARFLNQSYESTQCPVR